MIRTLLGWQEWHYNGPPSVVRWLQASVRSPRSRFATIGHAALAFTEHAFAATGNMTLPGVAACNRG